MSEENDRRSIRKPLKPMIFAGFAAIIIAAGGMTIASYLSGQREKTTASTAQTLAQDKADSTDCKINPKQSICVQAQNIVTDAKAGPQGLMGLQGPQGVPGPEGPRGPQGLMGILGASGAPGLAGPVGTPGLAGSNGANGLQGAQGLQGLPGATGPMGPVGPAGANGKDSTVPGPQGSPPYSWTWTEQGAVAAMNKTHTCTRSGGPDSAPTYTCS